MQSSCWVNRSLGDRLRKIFIPELCSLRPRNMQFRVIIYTLFPSFSVPTLLPSDFHISLYKGIIRLQKPKPSSQSATSHHLPTVSTVVSNTECMYLNNVQNLSTLYIILQRHFTHSSPITRSALSRPCRFSAFIAQGCSVPFVHTNWTQMICIFPSMSFDPPRAIRTGDSSWTQLKHISL